MTPHEEWRTIEFWFIIIVCGMFYALGYTLGGEPYAMLCSVGSAFAAIKAFPFIFPYPQ